MTPLTNERLLRVAYFSRNTINLPPEQAAWEVDKILETAQVNNAACGVTGALLFNDGAFAQILEGPGDAVEEVFDRIQLDDRHADVTILETEWVDERLFPNWSMAFAGSDAVAAGQYADIANRSAFDPERLTASDLLKMLGDVARRNELKLRAA